MLFPVLRRLAAALLLATPALAAQAAQTPKVAPVPRSPLLQINFEPPAGGTDPAPGAAPDGWTVAAIPAGGSVMLDTVMPHSGRFSLKLVRPTPPAQVRVITGAAETHRVTLPPSVVAVRLRVWIRTEGAGRATYYVTEMARAYPALRRPPAYAQHGDTALSELVWANGRKTAPTGTTPWTPYEVVLPVIAGKVPEIFIGFQLDGTGAAWFDDLTIAPLNAADVAAALMATSPSAAARTYVLAALDTLRKHTLHADQVDWPALRAHMLAGLIGARTPEDTYEAIWFALRAVNPHGLFYSPAAWAALGTNDTTAAPGDTTGGARPSGTVLGRHGYLAVPAIAAIDSTRMTRYAEAAHAALRAQATAGVCGYVVDLRGNTGGNAFPMFAAVGPLLYDRYVNRAEKWRYERGRLTVGDSVWVDVREPAPVRLTAPVAVLANGRTGSSGESMLLRFVGRPRTRTFGQPTYGFTTGNGDFALSDGARMLVTAGRMRDRTGRRYGGVVTPDEVVAPAAGDGPPLALGDDPVVRAATAWLDTQPACRPRAGVARPAR